MLFIVKRLDYDNVIIKLAFHKFLLDPVALFLKDFPRNNYYLDGKPMKSTGDFFAIVHRYRLPSLYVYASQASIVEAYEWALRLV